MPVQSTLNLPVRKTRLRSKLAVSETIERIEEMPRARRGRSKKVAEKEVVAQAVKRTSPIKATECSPSKRSPSPKERTGNAVRNLFTSPKKQNELNKSPVKSLRSERIAERCSPKKLLQEKYLQTVESPRKSTRNGSPMKSKSPTKAVQRKENQENIENAQSPRKTQSPVKKKQSSPVKRNKTVFTVSKADSTLYTQARHSLHTQLTDVIVGRDEEIKKLNEFIEPALANKKSTSIYVSGAPGTGKTVSLTHVLEKLSKVHKFNTVFINCMTVKNASSIYTKIVDGFSFKGSGLEGVQEGIKKKCCVIVLDEVDQLQSNNQQILYSLFELPKLKESKVVLVGIANALDLTDKTVPLLQSYGCRPHLYHFAPYSDKQIIAILKSRLSECQSIIKPMALSFLAKKIATCTGDVRKALDICRRAVEIVERQVRQQRILAARCDPSTPASNVLVDISHISQVISDVFNTRARGNQNLHTTLPLQQKLLLCALLVFIKRKNLKEVTMGKLHEVYGKVCKLAKVAAIDYSELQSICTLLESRALVSIKKSKESRQSKVRLAVDEAEVEQVLQDKNILATCMEEASIL